MTTHPDPQTLRAFVAVARTGNVSRRDGAALLPQAEKALAGLADFAQAAMRLHGTVRGTLRIGTVLDPAFTRLGAFLKALDVGFYIGLPDEFKPNQSVAQALIAPVAINFEVKPLMHFNYLVVAPPGWGRRYKAVTGRRWTRWPGCGGRERARFTPPPRAAAIRRRAAV